MATGDVNYAWLMGGCTVSAASGLTGLFGAVSSLSQINDKEVILLMVSASGGDAQITLGTSQSDLGSFRLTTGASVRSLPPMTAVTASQIRFAREGGNNPVVYWTAMVRVP